MLKTLIVLAAAAAACPAATRPAFAASGGVHRIDVTAACHGAADGLQDKAADKAQVQSCVAAEMRIRKDLGDNWSRYSAASRTQCSTELSHAYHASYVELISCLEMANPTMMRSKPAN
jgi:hypothetical protein